MLGGVAGLEEEEEEEEVAAAEGGGAEMGAMDTVQKEKRVCVII